MYNKNVLFQLEYTYWLKKNIELLLARIGNIVEQASYGNRNKKFIQVLYIY